MKKTLLTIAFTVASSWASFAQYTLIPKAGIALGSYSYDGEAEKSNLGLTQTG